jgi:hypothetical protein
VHERGYEMKCCNYNCDQGRLCPHKTNALCIADVAFTVVMILFTIVMGVSIMWWLITAVMMIAEAIK